MVWQLELQVTNSNFPTFTIKKQNKTKTKTKQKNKQTNKQKIDNTTILDGMAT